MNKDLHPDLGCRSLLGDSVNFAFVQAGYEDLCNAYSNHYTADDEDGIEADLRLMIHGYELGQVLIQARQ